jgi:hypothetical protein
MATVTGGLDLSIRCVVPERKSGLGAGAAGVSSYDHVFEYLRKYTTGIGTEHVGCVFSGRYSISDYVDIDLAADLVSVLDGSAVTAPIIMGLFIVNLTRTPGRHLILGQGVDPYEDWILTAEDARRIGPGGVELIWDPIDGFPTNGDTADVLRIAAGAEAETEFDILIVGRLS